MKIYAYLVPIDDGAAPNPYGGVCTLAICKPNLRKIAQEDDWIIGLDFDNRLIYTMKVTKVLSLKEYDSFTKEKLNIKIPDTKSKDIEKQMGDSVYDFSAEDITLRKSVHSRCTKEMDLAGKNVLLSSCFYYFGSEPKTLPKEFKDIVNPDIDFIQVNEELEKSFFKWLDKQNFEQNKIYAKPNRVGLITPNDRENEMSCCIRKKIEIKFFS
jgi:hypothetical protein